MCSFVELAEHGGGPSHPDCWGDRGRNVHVNDEVSGLASGTEHTSALASLVAGASILLLISLVVFLWLEPDEWHLVVQLSWELVIDFLLISVVASAIHVETVDVGTVLWVLIDLFNGLSLHHGEGEGELIDRDLVLSGVSLQGTSHETLWEEQARDPEALWRAVLQPIVNELDTLNQIGVPWSKWLQGWVGDLGPVGWHLIVLEAKIHTVKSLRHNDETSDSLLEIVEGGFHNFEHPVELLNFLNQHSGQRWIETSCHLELFLLTVSKVELFWQSTKEFSLLLQHDFISGHTATTTGNSRLNR